MGTLRNPHWQIDQVLDRTDLAAARNLDDGAEVAPARDVVTNHGLDVIEQILPPGTRLFTHATPCSLLTPKPRYRRRLAGSRR